MNHKTNTESLSKVAEEIYHDKPEETLFHYTSIDKFLNIIKEKVLWASDVRCFSDAGEITYTAELLQSEIKKKLELKNETILSETQKNQLSRLYDWLSGGLSHNEGLFVVSFSTKGNLLSQWRSYCPNAKGVSFGIAPDKLNQSNFRLAPCIYDEKKQKELANRLIKCFEDIFDDNGQHATPDLSELLEPIKLLLLKVALLIKNPNFKEEQEWRMVSNPHSKSDIPIEYRAGKSFLIPYVKIGLPTSNDKITLEQLYLGPTPHEELSLSSIKAFMEKNNVSCQNSDYCDIPYRTW